MANVLVKSLAKRFGKIEALRSVDVSIDDGRFIALMGPSGCGKTTLLRLIAGLEAADMGSIVIGERNVTTLPAEKRNIGLMFQSYALFPHMTAAENLAFPMRMRRGYGAAEREERVKRALDLVRLPGVADRYPRQLSGGQQQRVAFARALIDEPDVLLLDEPLSNLDARLRDEMQLELIDIRRQRPLTTILVTHDQTEGLTLADEIVVMRDGKIEQTGEPREVYANPATAFVADFLGGANLVPVETLQPAGNGRWQAQVANQTRILTPPPPNGQPGPATLVIRQEHLRILGPNPTVDVIAPGKVAAVAYRGQSAQVAVDALGVRLRIVAPAAAKFAAGEKVRIGWSVADTRLLLDR